MSIRLRLTLLYSTILALTLVAFSLVLYGTQAQYTLNAHERDLALGAQRTAFAIAMMYPDPDRLERRPGFMNPDRLGPFGARELRELRVRDIVRVLDAQGVAIEHPINQEQEALPLSEEGMQALGNGETWTEIAPVEGERWLIHGRPVVVTGQVVGLVQIGRSLADRDRSVRALAVALIVGSTLTTLVAFGVGWVLSGLTLGPIHRITQTAQAIGAERDFDRRVQHAGPNDEVGQLAITFNAMLAELQEAYQEIERALQMQRDFVADVSHELRTPLTTLRGNLALLRRDPPIQEDEREDILRDMVDESERLIRLVSDLLTLARADAGRQLQIEPIHAKPLIQEACRQAGLLEPSREIVCEPLLDVDVVADRGALKQVLLILLDNALRHTDGTIRVRITIVTSGEQGTKSTGQGPVSGECLAISVQDAGPGIEPEALSRIFERFYRGEPAGSRTGSGLGLAIAKGLVEAQGGTLDVKSQVDQGSVFTVTLPRATPFDSSQSVQR